MGALIPGSPTFEQCHPDPTPLAGKGRDKGFQWHGVKRGDAFAFYRGDIRVEGPHPFSSSGGNLANGRTRTAMCTDSIEQLLGHGRRTAGQGSGGDGAGGIHHSKQWRLDHVRQIPELTACEIGDHRLAAIALSHMQLI
jgi:hypothetical protein